MRALFLAMLAAQTFVPRENPTVTRLSNGRVVIAGGRISDGGIQRMSQAIDATRMLSLAPFTDAGLLNVPRNETQLAWRLWNDDVLSLGGTIGLVTQATVERLPADGGPWQLEPPLKSARRNACWARATDGRLAIIGGIAGNTAVLRFEVFSPLGVFEREGVLPSPAVDCRATGLNEGRVLVTAGGTDGVGTPSATVWLLTLATGAVTTASPLPQPRTGHELVALRDGGAWALGGNDNMGLSSSTLYYDVAVDRWTPGPTLPFGVSPAAGRLLADDSVLLLGGQNTSVLGRCLLVAPTGTTQHQIFPADSTRSSWTMLHTNHQLGFGATDNGMYGSIATLSLFRPSRTEPAGPLGVPRLRPAAASAADGRLLALSGAGTTSVEAFDSTARAWAPAGNLLEERSAASATLLLSGEVLVAGGTRGAALGSVERYDPIAGVSRAAAPLSVPRSGHRAVLTADGRVWVVGGGTLATELYDPQRDQWSAGPTLPFSSGAGVNLAALPDGRLLAHRGLAAVTWLPDAGALVAFGASPQFVAGADVAHVNAGISITGGTDAVGAPTTVALAYFVNVGWVSTTSIVVVSEPLSVALSSGLEVAGGGFRDSGVASTASTSMDWVSYNLSGPGLGPHGGGARGWLFTDEAVFFGGLGPDGGALAATDAIGRGDAPSALARPRISLPAAASPGDVLTIRGSGLAPPGGGGPHTQDDAAPTVVLRRVDDGLIYELPSVLVATDALVATLPAALPLARYAVLVVVRGAPSLGAPLKVAAPLGASCVQSWFCSSGLCDAGVCALPVMTPDAGNTSDAGAADAGFSDAGLSDAGELDAGLPPPDAGEDKPRQLGTGCGCSTGADAFVLLALTSLMVRRRRVVPCAR